jgi:hypothetical protein
MEKPKNRLIEREYLLGGICAGLVGGLLMAVVEMLISRSHGHGAYAPFRLIDFVMRGAPAGTAPTTGAFAGFLLHMAISGILGGVFSIPLRLLRRLSGMIDALWFGLMFSVIVWSAATELMVLFDRIPDFGVVLSITPEKWLLAHIVFGASLGLTPIFAKFFYRGEVREEEEVQRGLAA